MVPPHGCRIPCGDECLSNERAPPVRFQPVYAADSYIFPCSCPFDVFDALRVFLERLLNVSNVVHGVAPVVLA